MNKPEEILIKMYQKLLADYPEKWVKAAGDVCFMFLDNGLSICKYLDKDNSDCINLYTIDKVGSVHDEVIVRAKEDSALYTAFLAVYNKIKDQANTNRFLALERNISNAAYRAA
jgi:hypothetical protein